MLYKVRNYTKYYMFILYLNSIDNYKENKQFAIK